MFALEDTDEKNMEIEYTQAVKNVELKSTGMVISRTGSMISGLYKELTNGGSGFELLLNRSHILTIL